MDRRYVRIDHDETQNRVVMRVFGSTRAELFEHAAEAMSAIGYDVARIPPTYSRPIFVGGEGLEDLLVGWLETLLDAAEAERIVWSSFTVDRLEDGVVQGSASGMPFDTVVAVAPPAAGVAPPRPVIVDVPEGHWTDVCFDLGIPAARPK